MRRRLTRTLITLAALLALLVAPALAASPPPIQLPSRMTDYSSWPGWANT